MGGVTQQKWERSIGWGLGGTFRRAGAAVTCHGSSFQNARRVLAEFLGALGVCSGFLLSGDVLAARPEGRNRLMGRRGGGILCREEPEGHSRAWHLVFGLPVVASGSLGLRVDATWVRGLCSRAGHYMGPESSDRGKERDLLQGAGHELQEVSGHRAGRTVGHPGVPRGRDCPAACDTLPLTGMP